MNSQDQTPDVADASDVIYEGETRLDYRNVVMIAESDVDEGEGLSESEDSDAESVSSTRVIIESDEESEKEFEQFVVVFSLQFLLHL